MQIYNIVIIYMFIISVFACCGQELTIRINRYGLTKERKQKIYNRFFWFSVIILTSIAAMRGSCVGADMPVYIRLYHILEECPWKDISYLSTRWQIEPFFMIYCKVIQRIFGSNPQWFIAISSIITICGFGIFIKKNSCIPLLSLLVYICYGYWGNSFNVIRQYMAISIIILAITLIEEKKVYKGILLFVVANLMHTSSIVFLSVLIIRKRKFSNYIFLAFIILAITLFMIPDSLKNYIISFTSYSQYAGSQGSGLSTLLVLFTVFCIVFYLKKQIEIHDKRIDLWLWMLGIGICFNVLALDNGLFERIMRYYLVTLFFLVPDVVSVFDRRKNKLLYFLMVLICCGIFILYFYKIVMASSSSSGYIIPYNIFLVG